LAEASIDQEMPLHALAAPQAEPACLVLIGQELSHEPAEGRQVARVRIPPNI
jgi:hypothetical protein